ncbi:hypothetical protein FACS1894204_12920 [Synergistales bacterium]|nr:hypothetical protein FACS1894204_12920 [Synergistales bacterium]
MSEHWIDRAWKDCITENVDDALLFFKPTLAADRDYNRKPMLVSGELPAIGSDSDKGMRNSDVALSIPLKEGADQRIVFHIEQQHEPDKDLPLRMFQGYYRMSDRLQLPVTSLAILTGNIKPVNAYSTSCYGTELNFRFGVYHVASADIEELKRDGRVFALVILAAKRMLDAGESLEKRGRYSLELLSAARERGYDIGKMRNIQKFIYRVLRIWDENIDPKVREVWRMRLIPIDEAIREIHIRDAREEGMEEGLEKGLEKGLEEGEAKKAFEVARRMLSRNMSVSDIIDVTGLGEDDILSLS